MFADTTLVTYVQWADVAAMLTQTGQTIVSVVGVVVLDQDAVQVEDKCTS